MKKKRENHYKKNKTKAQKLIFIIKAKKEKNK